MQAIYPKRLSRTVWDPVHTSYPTQRFPETGISSESIGRQLRSAPDVLRDLQNPVEEVREYCRNYNVTASLTKSQTTQDYGYKIPESSRFNKQNSCVENQYVYPLSRKLSERVPALNVHGTSEMRDSFAIPSLPSRVVTDKDQFKHPSCLPLKPPESEVKPLQKELDQLDTTHDGFEKYLDPYLTTSRLHHRPFTAEVLTRPSNTKDVVTYYTYKDIPWTRTPVTSIGEWRLPLSRAKSMYDREKFKEDFREIRTHNKLRWAPGTFRTETRDNYIDQLSRPESEIHNYEEEVRSLYQRSKANLETNIQEQHSSVKKLYVTENSQTGSRKPLCSIIDQHIPKNKRLVCRSTRISLEN